ncbi:MAG: response regulator [Eubacterium sp.]|nr:response regulator [Eubacterium sp.]
MEQEINEQQETEQKVMLTSESESFLTRVIVKRLNDAGIKCEFVNWHMKSIVKAWDNYTHVTLFMDEGSHPTAEVLHFLDDVLMSKSLKMTVIGEESDVKYIREHIMGDVIYREFLRPMDNDEFVNAIKELFVKAGAGELKKSILVVDDDPNYLAVVRNWLKDTYKVAMVNSGIQAVKWLGNNYADLILLDYEMPVTTGPQVFEMLRSESETRDIPVIFLTSKSDKESVMGVLALKPEGYILKNISKGELLQKINEFFILHK